jgi:hypothetical protein
MTAVIEKNGETVSVSATRVAGFHSSSRPAINNKGVGMAAVSRSTSS